MNATVDALTLLKEAFLLRQIGERAPGGNENWHDWEQKTETYLRSLLDNNQELMRFCVSYSVSNRQYSTIVEAKSAENASFIAGARASLHAAHDNESDHVTFASVGQTDDPIRE